MAKLKKNIKQVGGGGVGNVSMGHLLLHREVRRGFSDMIPY